LFQRMGDAPKADAEFRTALRLAPHDPEVVNNYAVYLCQNGRINDGVRHFEEAAHNALYRTPEAAYTNAGVCLRAAKRDEEARAAMRCGGSWASPGPTRHAPWPSSIATPADAHGDRGERRATLRRGCAAARRAREPRALRAAGGGAAALRREDRRGARSGGLRRSRRRCVRARIPAALR